MSTSPSPTIHWNFDTTEARDAWAAVTLDHNAPGHVCYDCNNNVDDPSCSALANHSPSPTSDDDEAERTTSFRDVEEAEAHFPINNPA
jgi:hypothetical protein